eukprot:82381-Chlamydomonas_euryale.AAC.1
MPCWPGAVSRAMHAHASNMPPPALPPRPTNAHITSFLQAQHNDATTSFPSSKPFAHLLQRRNLPPPSKRPFAHLLQRRTQPRPSKSTYDGSVYPSSPLQLPLEPPATPPLTHRA